MASFFSEELLDPPIKLYSINPHFCSSGSKLKRKCPGIQGHTDDQQQAFFADWIGVAMAARIGFKST